MTNPLNLTFDPGSPMDAGQLQKLVTYLNEVNANSLRLPDFSGVANKAVAQRLVAGTATFSVSFSTFVRTSKRVNFDTPLLTDPASIQFTLEGEDLADLICYIKSNSGSTNGFDLYFDRVAGIDKTGKPTTGSKNYGTVKVHYFAVAKSSALQY